MLAYFFLPTCNLVLRRIKPSARLIFDVNVAKTAEQPPTPLPSPPSLPAPCLRFCGWACYGKADHLTLTPQNAI